MIESYSSNLGVQVYSEAATAAWSTRFEPQANSSHQSLDFFVVRFLLPHSRQLTFKLLPK